MNEPRKWLRLHIRRYGEGQTDFVYKNIDDEVDIGKKPKLDVSEGMQETKKIGYYTISALEFRIFSSLSAQFHR